MIFKFTNPLLAFLFLVLWWVPAVWAQDNCDAATVLTIQNGSCTTTVNGTTVGATASPQTALIPFAKDDDVWYKFTTPSGAAETRFTVMLQLSDISYVGASTGFYLERREGTANICADYFPDNHYIDASATNKQWLMSNLLPGTEYSIRLYTDGNTSRANFKICLYFPTPPANDNCSSPQVLTVGATCVPSGPFSTTTATQSSQPSGDGSGRDDDVWFSFTTGATAQKFAATLSSLSYNTGFGNPVIELWTGCNALENAGFFPFATSADFGLLNPSTTYYIRVYTYSTSSRLSAFNICVTALNPPANDECTGTVPVGVGSSDFGPVVNGTTLNAGQSSQPIGSCSVTPDDDVWYSFVAPASGNVQMKLENVVHPDNPSIPNIFFMVLAGTCESTSVVTCGSGNQGIFTGLTTGQTYYLRLMTQDVSTAANFSLSMKQVIGLPNDDCAGAETLAVNTNNTFDIKTTGSTLNALPSGIPITAPCNALGLQDVWYRFTAPASGSVLVQLFDVVNTAGAGSTTMFTIAYSGSCGVLTQFKCIGTNAQDVLTGLTPGATYYLRTMSYNIGQSHNFNLGVMEIMGTQNNGTCAGIRTLTHTWQRGSTLGQPMGNGIVACYGGIAPNRVVYYQFTATATTHYIDFTNWARLSLNAINVGYRVYSGDCTGNPVTKSVKCVASVRNANDTIANLQIGETYTVMVMENTFNGGPAEFSVRLAPPNTNVWVGTIDDNWNKPDNWSAGMVPDENTEVIIPSGRRVDNLPRYPIIKENIRVRSIKIDPNTKIDVAPGVVVTVEQ